MYPFSKIKAHNLIYVILAATSASLILFISAVILTLPGKSDQSDSKSAVISGFKSSSRTAQVGAVSGGDFDTSATTIATSLSTTTYENDEIVGPIIPENDRDKEPPKEEKIIILWTAWWGDKYWKKIFRRNDGPMVTLPATLDDYGNIIQQRQCRLSLDRGLQNVASSFLYHSWDLQPDHFDDVPDVRYPWQTWVFWMIEPPPRSGLLNNHDWDQAEKMGFNLTMSYLQDADIWFPYGRIYEYPAETRHMISVPVKHRIEAFTKDFASRTTDAVWIVSDC